jgi:hypothetical protein
MDPAAQVFQVGQADEIPFCHGPHVDQLEDEGGTMMCS